MKREWSPSWISSVQPRKQRKYRHNAPLHVRQKFVSSNLSPELRKRFAKRSMQLRKGDEVRVMRGGFKSKTGTVERVDLSGGRIYLEELKIKKVDGSEVPRALQPSNLMITKLKLDDKRRQAILDRIEQARERKTEPVKAKPPEKRPDEKKPDGKKQEAKPAGKAPARKPDKSVKKPVKARETIKKKK